jgi:hypothetical protein
VHQFRGLPQGARCDHRGHRRFVEPHYRARTAAQGGRGSAHQKNREELAFPQLLHKGQQAVRVHIRDEIGADRMSRREPDKLGAGESPPQGVDVVGTDSPQNRVPRHSADREDGLDPAPELDGGLGGVVQRALQVGVNAIAAQFDRGALDVLRELRGPHVLVLAHCLYRSPNPGMDYPQVDSV